VGFPAGFFQRLAHAGSLAPSGDNLQPWSFEIDEDKLLLRHDAQRDQSLFNVHQLASFIALGAVIENVTIACTKDNFRATVEYFPNTHDSNVVARIIFQPGASVDPLVDFLEKRCTNRKPYERGRLDIAARKRLHIDLTRYPGVEISWLYDQGHLKKIGQVVAKADRLIFENERIHGHLFSTIRWNRSEVERTRDGLPIETLELGTVGSCAFRALRHWSVVRLLNGIGFSAMASQQSAMLMRRCSAAGLIAAPDAKPVSFLRVGQAFQRLWLRATQVNLALQPMTAVIFFQLRSRLSDYDGLSDEQRLIVDRLRRELEAAFAPSKPVIPAMLFRVGFAVAPSHRTIRRKAM
jgi:hypothetical protein